MKTLYVHIGMPKTGTTAIQNFCTENRKILNQKGYHYPMFPHIYGTTIAHVRNGHFLVPEEFANNQEVYRKNMDRILELFETYPNIILSDEAIWTPPSKCQNMWKALKEESTRCGFQVKIILYLRRQDLYLSSIWNQYIKTKSATIAWEDFVRNPSRAGKMNYGTNLEHIISVWGKDAVTVRRFEPERFAGGSVYADFLQAAGLDMTDEYTFSQYIRNTRLAGNTHEIMRIINGMPGADYTKKRFFREILLSYADLSDKDYKTEMFAKEEARIFMQKYHDENRRVSEIFFDGEDLFNMEWKDIPKWEKDNPHMQDDLIRFVATCSMQLMERNEQLEQEITRLSKEVTRLNNEMRKIRHPFRAVSRKVTNKIKKG